MEEYETVYNELTEHSGGVLRVTINNRTARFHGWKKGTPVKVLIREMTEEEVARFKKNEG